MPSLDHWPKLSLSQLGPWARAVPRASPLSSNGSGLLRLSCLLACFLWTRGAGGGRAGCSAEGEDCFPPGWPQVRSDCITSASHARSVTFHAGAPTIGRTLRISVPSSIPNRRVILISSLSLAAFRPHVTDDSWYDISAAAVWLLLLHYQLFLHDLAVVIDVLNQPKSVGLNPPTGRITAPLIRGRENN